MKIDTLREFDQRPRWKDPARHAVNEFVKRAAAAAQGARVLDAGAGECVYKKYFADSTYVAADLAVGDAGWDYRKLDVISRLAHLPLADAAFDHVLCTGDVVETGRLVSLAWVAQGRHPCCPLAAGGA